jgi:hypothetical protein
MIKLDVKTEVAEVRAGLAKLGAEVGGIDRKILRALATVGKKRVKARMGSFLRLGHNSGTLATGSKGKRLAKGDTGEGLRGAVYGFARSRTHAVIASGQVFKAESLERGATIRATGAKMLSFRGDDGSWHRGKQFAIPPKRWFSRSVAGLEDDPDYKETPDKVLGKCIKKAGLS